MIELTHLQIPVTNGWQLNKIEMRSLSSILVLVRFEKEGQEPVQARWDLGKMILIDPLPSDLTVTRDFLLNTVCPHLPS